MMIVKNEMKISVVHKEYIYKVIMNHFAARWRGSSAGPLQIMASSLTDIFHVLQASHNDCPLDYIPFSTPVKI